MVHVQTYPPLTAVQAGGWLARDKKMPTGFWWAVSWALAAERPGLFQEEHCQRVDVLLAFPQHSLGCIQSAASGFGVRSAEDPQDARGAGALPYESGMGRLR